MINTVDRIKELIAQSGLSGYELANQSGVSANAIYDWINLGAEPTLLSIIKICEACEVSLSEFFCGTKTYMPTKEESNLLQEVRQLTKAQKAAVYQMINTFMILKRKNKK